MASPLHTVLVGFNVPGKKDGEDERRFEAGDSINKGDLSSAQVHDLVDAGVITGLREDPPAEADAEPEDAA